MSVNSDDRRDRSDEYWIAVKADTPNPWWPEEEEVEDEEESS